MRHERFRSIFDALTHAVHTLEAQPGPLPIQKQELLQQLRAQIAAIVAAQSLACPPSFVGPLEPVSRQANRRSSVCR